MTTPTLGDVFSSELMPGETIEWTGQPNPAVIFHRGDWGAIPSSFICGGFAILWLLAASGLLPLGSQKDHFFHPLAIIFGTPFVLLGQYLIWGRFVYAWWKKKRTYYALTDRRVLIVRYEFRNRASSSVMLDTLPMIDKHVRYDGIGSISFGARFQAEWQWGRNSQTPRAPSFDDIENADSIYQTVLRLQDQARRSRGATQSHW